MAEITEIYKCVNVLLDTHEQLQQLKQDTGTYGNMNNYYELDKDTYQEFNISIPNIIGDELYEVIDMMIDNKEIDYIRFYYEN